MSPFSKAEEPLSGPLTSLRLVGADSSNCFQGERQIASVPATCAATCLPSLAAMLHLEFVRLAADELGGSCFGRFGFYSILNKFS